MEDESCGLKLCALMSVCRSTNSLTESINTYLASVDKFAPLLRYSTPGANEISYNDIFHKKLFVARNLVSTIIIKLAVVRQIMSTLRITVKILLQLFIS